MGDYHFQLIFGLRINCLLLALRPGADEAQQGKNYRETADVIFETHVDCLLVNVRLPNSDLWLVTTYSHRRQVELLGRC
jgi:hypothetical protein